MSDLIEERRKRVAAIYGATLEVDTENERLVEQLAALIAYVENDRTAFCAEVQPARRVLAARAERLGKPGEAAGWASEWMLEAA